MTDSRDELSAAMRELQHDIRELEAEMAAALATASDRKRPEIEALRERLEMAKRRAGLEPI